MLETATLLWQLAGAANPAEFPAPGQTFSVTYRAAPDCPTQAQFEAAIVARAPRARSSASAEVRMEAELSPEPGNKRRLRIFLDDGSSQDREIDADDCVEAVQSMAVIAAMVLASRVPEPRPAPAPAPAPAAVPVPASTSVPTTAQGRHTSDVSTSPQRPARPTWFAGSIGAGLESAAAPGPALAASISTELGSVTGSVLAPSVRVSALFGQAADHTMPVGSARFRLALGRLHGCALRFGLPTAEVRLCAVVEGGALLARGLKALNQRSQNMPWFGAGLGAIGAVALSPRFALELAGSGRRLFVRDQFIFAPDTLVHQPSVFAWDFRVGLAHRFW
jgi:hypothetical protein